MSFEINLIHKLFLNVSTLALLLPGALVAQPLPEAVRSALQEAGVAESDFHVVVRPLSGASKLALEAGADEPVLTASVFKVVTSAAALDSFGPAKTWRTLFLSSEPPDGRGRIPALYVKASGAPWIPVSDFREAVGRLRGAGVKEIAGALVIDRSVFGEPPIDPKAFDGEPFRPYNQGPDAFALGLQSVTYYFAPDAASGVARVTRVPVLSGYAVPEAIVLEGGPCPSNLTRAILPEGDAAGIRFKGAYPRACGARAWSAVPWPGTWFGDRYAGETFRVLWQEAGGRWSGAAEPGRVPDGAQELLAFASKPLSDIVKDINKESINPMARNLFLLLSTREGRSGTLEASRRALSEWLEEKGIDAAGFAPDNGSGLSRTERASARQIAGVLALGYNAWWAPEFLASLPIAGVDGTMKRRGISGGSARVKTGYIRGVRSAAGYVKAASGAWYAVCAIINSPAALQGGKAIDALLESVAEGG